MDRNDSKLSALVQGTSLAREKLDLLKQKIENLCIIEIKMASQSGDEGSSNPPKNKRNEKFNFSNKNARTTGLDIGS